MPLGLTLDQFGRSWIFSGPHLLQLSVQLCRVATSLLHWVPHLVRLAAVGVEKVTAVPYAARGPY